MVREAGRQNELEWGVAEAEDKYERGSTLTVARGLHVFRYVAFQGAGVPAIARLIPPSDGVTLMDAPGRGNGYLQRPGDCVVLRADRASEVVVGLRRGSADGSLEASFRLEALALTDDTATFRADAATAASRPAGVSTDSAALSFIAHLANRGDVPFGQNVWAGGPDLPAAVEGLEILGDAKSAPLQMQVLVGSRPPRWSEWVGAGQYAGTRGHGLPLLGLRLRVTPGATGSEVAAEVLFLGALVATQRGRQVEFLSGSGVDPLVGVKIGLQSAQDGAAVRPALSADARTFDREPRVRVFRASSVRQAS